MAGRVAHVVEHLPIKCEAQGSNPSTIKKRYRDIGKKFLNRTAIGQEQNKTKETLKPDMVSKQ
jgi:hypothetical protein